MKFITPLFLSFCTLVSCAQIVTSTNHIKGNKYEGYVFAKDYASRFVQFKDAKERFTPSDSDIVKAEAIISRQIKSANVSQVNQGSGCPIIDKNLFLYKRQYIGYTNNNGDRIIWVNFIGGKERKNDKQLSKDILVILDGCSYYWNIKINLRNSQVFDLQINGAS